MKSWIFLYLFNIPHQPPVYSVSVLWQNTCNSCVADVFILSQHWRLRLATFTTSMSCDPEREMKTPSWNRLRRPAPCHEPQAPFTVTSPRVAIPFTPLQYMKMMLIFTTRWRLHRGRNPCRLWSYALFKYSSFSNRPSNAKKCLKSRRVWTSNRPLQRTVKEILPFGGNSFTISY